VQEQERAILSQQAVLKTAMAPASSHRLCPFPSQLVQALVRFLATSGSFEVSSKLRLWGGF